VAESAVARERRYEAKRRRRRREREEKSKKGREEEGRTKRVIVRGERGRVGGRKGVREG
jgi:hypothetical protein